MKKGFLGVAGSAALLFTLFACLVKMGPMVLMARTVPQAQAARSKLSMEMPVSRSFATAIPWVCS